MTDDIVARLRLEKRELTWRAADAIERKDAALRDCLVWIKADDAFATDFPDEHETIITKIKEALNDRD